MLAWLALAPAAYLAGHVCICGFATVTPDSVRALAFILPVAGLVYAAVWLALALRRLR